MRSVHRAARSPSRCCRSAPRPWLRRLRLRCCRRVALAAQTASISFDIPLRDARDAFERAYFEYHLARENGSMTRVAEKTGLERTHLYRKLKQLGVDLGKNKGE